MCEGGWVEQGKGWKDALVVRMGMRSVYQLGQRRLEERTW